MEGFLFKKGRGESSFGRKNWKKRWFILEGGFLTYFEGFDVEKGKPFNQKGVIPVNGCTIKADDKNGKKFAFDLLHPERKPISLQCLDDKTHKHWIAALAQAVAGKLGPSSIDFDPYYKILGLKKEDNPDASEINRAYRKIALKVHPDKGGDIREFEKIQEALDILLSKIEEEEREKLYETIYVDAKITKGPPGVGFGMVVVEDPKKAIVMVKNTLPTMKLISLSANAKMKILPQDRLMMIGVDDVSTWSLNRIIQRLSDFRVPVGSEVQMRFARKVRKDGTEEPIEVDPTEQTDPTAPFVPQPTSTTEQTDTGSSTSSAASSGYSSSQQSTPHQTRPPDHEYHQKSSIRRNSVNSSRSDTSSSNTANAGAGTGPGPGPGTGPGVAASAVPRTLTRRISIRSGTSTDPVIRAGLESENEELRQELSDTKKLLLLSNEERNKYHEELKKLQTESDYLKDQNRKLQQYIADSRIREEYLELQLQQAIMQYKVNPEQVKQSMKDMIKVSSLVQTGRSIPTTPELQGYLAGLEFSGSTNQVNAQRLSIQAVSAVDSTGSLLRKWELSGKKLNEKFMKLEDRIAKAESSAEEKNLTNKGAFFVCLFVSLGYRFSLPS